MALNREYFDAIHIDVVKKKYYNANKVQAVLDDIRIKAEALTAENERLNEQVTLLAGQKEEIGDAILSAKTIAQQMIKQAQEEAETIIAEAKQQSEGIIAQAAKRQEAAANQMAECFQRVKQLQEESIELLNAQWQGILCSLYDEDELPAAEAAVPEDIGEKLGAIARDIMSLEE